MCGEPSAKRQLERHTLFLLQRSVPGANIPDKSDLFMPIYSGFPASLREFGLRVASVYILGSTRARTCGQDCQNMRSPRRAGCAI